MIFVILGTQKFQFTRLLKKIDELEMLGIIDEEIIVQCGYTEYKPKSQRMTTHSFLNQIEINDYQNKANLIITHGGVGSILECLKLNKKIIAVPRLFKYNEHINDHQLEIVRQYSQMNYIMPIYDIDDLDTKIVEINSFIPTIFESNNTFFVNELKKYINKLIN